MIKKEHFKLINIIEAHSQEVLSVSFSIDNKFLASTSDDKTIKI